MDNYITSQHVTQGALIAKEQRIKLMSPDKWEEFIKEWLETKKDKYFDVDKCGGAGDMGRDVVAYIDDPQQNPDTYEWECYQCKHYKQPLSPTQVWVEFGKIIYYSFLKEYPIPQKYYFVAPHGVGTALSNLLNNPPKLRIELKKNWDKYCKDTITKKKSVALSSELEKYIDDFDFTIFQKLKIKTVIDEHKNHENHLPTFGGRLPDRLNMDVPSLEKDTNLRYIKQLVKAYDSATDETINNVDSLPKKYQRHFNDARKSFYKAEELRMSIRDSLPNTVFLNLKNDIFNGVINTVEDEFENGYKKAKEVEDKATTIIVESNPLREMCQTIDKKGLCHHLVNDKKISWLDDEDDK